MNRVIVVGAGIAGLALARDLARRSVPVTLLESSDRLGGQLASVEVGGVVVDAAAESFATRGGSVAALAAELGLPAVPPLDAPAWLLGRNGSAAPLPAASVLGIPAYPFAPDVQAVIGAAGAWRALLDKLLPMLLPEKYASLGDLVRRRMGRRVFERLVDPDVRGVHSTTADALPIDAASPELRQSLRRTGSLAAAVAELRTSSAAGSQVGGVEGGVHRIADRLAELAAAFEMDIRTGVRVVAAEAGAVTLEDGERVQGRVVVAAPGIASAPTRQREIVVAIAAVESAQLGAAPRGTGALIEPGFPGVVARAFTHSSAKWAWIRAALDAQGATQRHLIRLSYDGVPEDPEGRVLADLRAITGVDDARLEDLAIRSWVRTLGAAPVVSSGADPGPLVVGEAASGTGLATIVPRARALAAELTDGGEP